MVRWCRISGGRAGDFCWPWVKVSWTDFCGFFVFSLLLNGFWPRGCCVVAVEGMEEFFRMLMS